MAIFGHPEFTVFWEKLLEKFGMAIFGHSEFIPVFFWEKLLEKIQNSQFWPFQIYTSLLGKNCQKKSEWPFLIIPNLYRSFWEKLSEKIRMATFGHSKFIPVFLGNIVRNIWNGHFGHSKIFLTIFLFISY